MKRWLVPAAAICICLFSLSAWSQTLELLDQSYIVDQDLEFRPYIIWQGIEKAQTFSVGTTGFLSRVDLQVLKGAGPSPLTESLVLSINTTFANGSPSSTTLGTHSIAPEEVSFYLGAGTTNLVSVDLRPLSVSVLAGQTLALVLASDTPAPPDQSAPSEASYGFITSLENGYQGGNGWHRDSGDAWAFRDYDFGFQTFVTPIPEPMSLTLLSLGSLAVVMVRRRG